MAEVGPKWRDDTTLHVDLMIAAFSEVLKLTSWDGVTVKSDIAYGSHERQRLDVYMPSESAAAPPVVLFVHGGGFVSGHRNRTAQIYSNVRYYLAQHGIAAINVGYRLATHVTYPGDAGSPGRAVRGRGKAANTSSKAVFPVSVISPQARYRSRRNRKRIGANHGTD